MKSSFFTTLLSLAFLSFSHAIALPQHEIQATKALAAPGTTKTSTHTGPLRIPAGPFIHAWSNYPVPCKGCTYASISAKIVDKDGIPSKRVVSQRITLTNGPQGQSFYQGGNGVAKTGVVIPKDANVLVTVQLQTVGEGQGELYIHLDYEY
jgi:hypothetical protein